MYRVTHRLELMRHKFKRWNLVEVGDIFERLKKVKASITALQMREDRDGGLLASDLNELQTKLSLHHSLLQ